MGLLRNLSIMLGNVVTRKVDGRLFDWIDAVSNWIDGNNPAMSQSEWFIDPTNGSDVNDGKTAATALKTDAERQRRMGAWPLWTLDEYHFRYLNDVPSTDPVNLVGNFLNPSTTIYVHGSATNGQGKTTLASLAANAVTAVNHATNTPLLVTANAIAVSWTTDGLLNNRCRMTGGANVGAVMWPIADLGAKQARMSEGQQGQAFGNPLAFQTGTFTPGANDTFVVESLTALANLVIDMGSVSNGITTNTVVLDSLKLNLFSQSGTTGVYGFGCDYASTSTLPGFGRSTSFVGTKFRGNTKLNMVSTVTLANCCADDSASGRVIFSCAAGSQSALIRFMTQQRQGCTFTSSGNGNVGSTHKPWDFQSGLGIFGNSAGPGVEAYGASCNSTEEIWGVCGAGGTPIQLRTGASFAYSAAPPGNAGLYFIDCTAAPATAWISYVRAGTSQTTAPAFDPATSTFTAYRALTAASLQATLGGGGLNGQWFDPPSGCYMAAI